MPISNASLYQLAERRTASAKAHTLVRLSKANGRHVRSSSLKLGLTAQLDTTKLPNAATGSVEPGRPAVQVAENEGQFARMHAEDTRL